MRRTYHQSLLPVAVGISVILAGLAYYTFINPTTPRLPNIQSNLPLTLNPADKAIAKVGEEVIYQKDLDQLMTIEAKDASPGAQADLKKNLIGKLVYQSVVLQAAQKEKLTSLDFSVYNSTDKDLNKRSQVVASVVNTLNDQAQGIHGSIISIHFGSPDTSLAYDKAKQMAYESIKPIYDKVQKGELTMKQATEQLSIKTELQKLSRNVKPMHYRSFRVMPSAPITGSTKFDNLLKTTPEGQITELYLANNTDYHLSSPSDTSTQASNAEKQDRAIAYMFGKIDKIVRDSSKMNAGSWYQERVGKYEVVYY